MMASENLRNPDFLLWLQQFVVLSASLMRHWLAPEEAERLKNAWRVGSGQRRIMEALVQTLHELPAETLKARWLSSWQHEHEGGAPLPAAARRAHETLYEKFRRA
jgi:hypothetical protein